MSRTTGRRRATIALAVVFCGMQSLACAGEPTAAREEATGDAPEPAATAQQRSDGESLGEAKPALSEKMRSLIAETESAAAANTALMAFYSAGLSEYEVDEAGVLGLGREYLAAGDDTRAEVVFSFLQLAAYQVTGAVSADVWAAHGDVSAARGNTSRAKEMYEQALGMDPGHAYAQQRLSSLGGGPAPKPSSAPPSPAASGERPNRFSPGRRDDLARFRFRYAEVGGSGRELWLSETCYNSGVLRAVPRWEDTAPWVFRSVSEAVFEQVDVPAGRKPVRLEFELHHGHGGVLALVVSGGSKGRFEVEGYLPEGFEPEMGTCD